MNVCVIGLGYVGLTLATVLAENGCTVIGVEKNPDILNHLNEGRAHFFEPGLNDRLKKVLTNRNFYCFEHLDDAMQFLSCDVYIITVGTPLDVHGKPRMDMVTSVSNELMPHLKSDDLVVLRSTVAIGTTGTVIADLLNKSGKNISIAFCPERTLEGNALAELRELPQIIGGVDAASTEKAALFFGKITNTTVKVSSTETAELIKLMDNSYRDTFFAFGNQLALISDSLDLDAHEVVSAANLGYPRTNLALPGLVGGPCLSKDPIILWESLISSGSDSALSRSAREMNVATTEHVAQQIVDYCQDHEFKRILLSGMAFKGRPVTDDMRGSPSIDLHTRLRVLMPDAAIECHDFEASNGEMKKMNLIPGTIEGGEIYDVVILANNHPRYSTLNSQFFGGLISKGGLLYDLWGATRKTWPQQKVYDFAVMGLGWR